MPQSNRKRYSVIDKALDRSINTAEKRIRKSYENSLSNLRGYFAQLYEQYGNGRTLDYTNLTAYGGALVKQIHGEVKRQTDWIYNSMYADIVKDLRNVYVYSWEESTDILTKSSGVALNPAVMLDVVDTAMKTPVGGLTIDMRFDGYKQQLFQRIMGQVDIASRQELTVRELAQNIADQMQGNGSWIKRIVETEGHRLMEEAKFQSVKDAEQQGVQTMKTWVTMGDSHVRDAHVALDGTTIPVDEPFHIGNDSAMYPSGFAYPENSIGCRCWLEYSTVS